MLDLTDRVALVTGASGNLGSVLARRFAACGGTVVALDRKPRRLAERFPDLWQSETLVAYEADLGDRTAVESAVERAANARGRIDCVVNTVGAFAPGGSAEIQDDDHWRAMLDANFRSVLQVCRAVVPVFQRQGGGVLVNVGSKAALAGMAGSAAYSVAKSAVLRLTETIATEGWTTGIRAHCVLPGTLDTPANRTAMPEADRSEWVDPEALVDVILFLVSPAARALRGAALPIPS